MQALCWFLVLSSLCVFGIAHGASRLGETTQAALQSQKLIYVTTQRATGEWSSRSAVWFMHEDDAVYFITKPSSYKARRIQRGSPVQVWVDQDTGPALIGEAQIVTEQAIIDRVDRVYRRKYWAAWFTYWAIPLAGRVGSGKMVVIQIVPAE